MTFCKGRSERFNLLINIVKLIRLAKEGGHTSPCFNFEGSRSAKASTGVLITRVNY